MADAGIDDDRVHRPLGTISEAVRRPGAGLGPLPREIRRGARGETWIDLDGRHLACRPDDLGEDGAVIADAGADMHDLGPGIESELVEEEGPEAGLAVVQPTLLVNRHQ